MTKDKLKETLHELVFQFGFEQVNRSLREIRLADRQLKSSKQSKALSDNVAVMKLPRRKPKISASEYVAKMELSSEKEPIVIELATRFESKGFLPRFGDIDYFCRFYGIVTPASRSRASSIPRVFKYIASMETGEIRRILDDGMFSGPSRLGPIADAIRRNGRARKIHLEGGS